MHDADAEPVPSVAAGAAHLRWKRLGMLSAAALLLHAAAFSGIDWAWPDREPPVLPATALQVRLVEVAAPSALSAVVVAEPPVAEPLLVVRPAAAPPRARAVRVAALARIEAPAAAPIPDVTTAPTPDAAASLQLALNAAPVTTVAAAPAESAAAAEESVPHYRTQMPPATTLRYEMQRGLLRGTGDLSWRPRGDRYELRLEARVSGLSVLTQASAGGFDAAGIAPLRFTDQRLRRATTAANFQRSAHKITFSGPSTEFALREGAQDRLSWMVQLAAIVAADAQLAKPGARVAMYVVGSHGDAGVWSFRCIGPEAVETRAGSIQAIKYVREPREAYDTTVQVWLDPLQHDLPVRATQKSGDNDEGFDLRLQEVIASN